MLSIMFNIISNITFNVIYFFFSKYFSSFKEFSHFYLNYQSYWHKCLYYFLIILMLVKLVVMSPLSFLIMVIYIFFFSDNQLLVTLTFLYCLSSFYFIVPFVLLLLFPHLFIFVIWGFNFLNKYFTVIILKLFYMQVVKAIHFPVSIAIPESHNYSDVFSLPFSWKYFFIFCNAFWPMDHSEVCYFISK